MKLMCRFMYLACIGIVISLTMNSCSGDEVGKEKENERPLVKKSNPMKVFMHYMPWYQSKDISGYWGSHWRMNTANPDIVQENGQRQIASHYYPLIGPYDSSDPEVIEYHLLLMRYAGIDAVLLDWYSSFNVNDYRPILKASNALIGKTEEAGLRFAVVYEEYTAEAVQEKTSTSAVDAAKADLLYIEEHYFNHPQYLVVEGKPLLLTFGPRYFKDGEQWENIFSAIETSPLFVSLWNHGALTGETDSGEFSWVDFDADLAQLHQFYGRNSLDVLIGSAYARFHDYYEEGNWGNSYGSVPYNSGETLERTLAKATERGIEMIQLVTWNDFGEGTMLEPTVEDGFQSLIQIQEFTGVPYGEEELQLIHQYYLKKKKYGQDENAVRILQEAFDLLCELEVEKATQKLSELE